MVLADSCFNLTHDSFDHDLFDVIEEAQNEGIEYFFTPSSSKLDIEKIFYATEKISNLYVGVGIHPHHASEINLQTADEFKAYAMHKKVVAIGEIGLDYFRNFQSPSIQKKCFDLFLGIATDIHKPVFLHHREAFNDFYPMVKNALPNLPQSIVHCFTGTKDELKAFLDLGLYIGITGWICDPKRGMDVRGLLKYIPTDRLIVETDAPYLMPKNLAVKPKNRRNEPKYLINVVEEISSATNIKAQTIAEASTKNFKSLFGV